MLLLLRSLAQVGAVLVALDLLQLELLLLLHSPSCLELTLAVLDSLQLDTLLLPHSLAQSDFAAPAPDLSRFELPLLALDPYTWSFCCCLTAPHDLSWSCLFRIL